MRSNISKNVITSALLSALLIGSVPAFAVQTKLKLSDITIPTASEENQLATKRATTRLTQSHYRKISLDDDFSEKIKNMQGYRTLALNRGEKLGVLKVGFEHQLDRIIRIFEARFKTKNAYVDEVIQQAVKKKIVLAIERRIRTELTEVAEDGAIQLFSENLRNLFSSRPNNGRIQVSYKKCLLMLHTCLQ